MTTTLAPSHTHDPEESRQAASQVDTARQYRQVLTCLYEAGEALTDDAIAARCGLLRHSAGTRRGVGVKRNHVMKVGRGRSALGNPASTWTLTEDGRAWVEGR